MGCSPIYTKRMQKALKYEGDDVITIFKGLQLDIGAPPQFMDFRYTVHDRWHGEFHLDHCGALLDVEPMGEDYVRGMCHDIEDPTFDATAVATNRKAQIRPDPPSAADTGRPASALRVDRDHRRVVSSGRRPSGAGCHSPNPRRQNRTRPDRSRRRGPVGLLRRAGVGLRLRRVLALGAGADGRRGVPADAPAEPVVRHRGWQARGDEYRTGDGDLHQAAHRPRGHRRRTHPSRAGPARRDRGCGAGARAASAVQSRPPMCRPSSARTRCTSTGRPRTRTGRGSRWSAPPRPGRCRRSSPRSIRISTWRSQEPRPTGRRG